MLHVISQEAGTICQLLSTGFFQCEMRTEHGFIVRLIHEKQLGNFKEMKIHTDYLTCIFF